MNLARIPKSQKFKDKSLRNVTSFVESETELSKLDTKEFIFKVKERKKMIVNILDKPRKKGNNKNNEI